MAKVYKNRTTHFNEVKIGDIIILGYDNENRIGSVQCEWMGVYVGGGFNNCYMRDTMYLYDIQDNGNRVFHTFGEDENKSCDAQEYWRRPNVEEMARYNKEKLIAKDKDFSALREVRKEYENAIPKMEKKIATALLNKFVETNCCYVDISSEYIYFVDEEDEECSDPTRAMKLYYEGNEREFYVENDRGDDCLFKYLTTYTQLSIAEAVLDKLVKGEYNNGEID